MNSNIKLAQLKASRERAINLKNILKGAILIYIMSFLLTSVFLVLGTILVAFFTCPSVIEYKFGALNGFLKGILTSIIIAVSEILFLGRELVPELNFIIKEHQNK